MDQTASVGDAIQEASGNLDEQQSGEDFGGKDSVAYDTHRKLLGEKKKLQENFASVKQQLEALQRERENEKKKALEEQGKFKELYESERQRVEQIEKSRIRDLVRNTCKQEAIRAGCVDPEDAWKLGNAELLQYDADQDSVANVDGWLKDLKDRKPFLFGKTNVAGMNPVKPGGPVDMKPRGVESYNKLTSQERQNLWMKAFNKGE